MAELFCPHRIVDGVMRCFQQEPHAPQPSSNRYAGHFNSVAGRIVAFEIWGRCVTYTSEMLLDILLHARKTEPDRSELVDHCGCAGIRLSLEAQPALCDVQGSGPLMASRQT